MKTIRNYTLLCIVSYLLSSYITVHRPGHALYGTVVSKATGKPLPGVYLFTVQGEEEGVTNRQGAFRFMTWQEFPAKIFVRNEKNEDVPVSIVEPASKIVIRL